ncbi:MAG: hypothetical protein KAR47_11280, partial [Planctomycetes bacterium]|nr:hypothetical protein [Planctomycetota bacterium]
KKRVFKKHSHYWAKNKEKRIFELKTMTKKHKNEQNNTIMNKKTQLCAQNDTKWDTNLLQK